MTTTETVFIVDDDPAARDSVQMLVKAHGLPAETFSSGEEFLEKYEPSRHGCLVLDLRMEGMSGLELQQRLHELQIRIPVIITTGHADVATAVEAMELGAVTLLEKPYSEDGLWQRIQEALQQDRQQREVNAEKADIAARLERLSAQERAVMELVVAGQLNKVIARRLGVSLRTVERERANVFDKIGVDSVAQLVERVLLVKS